MLERLPALAAELARLPVDVIVAPTNPSIAAAMQATRRAESGFDSAAATAAARQLGRSLVVAEIRRVEEIEDAFATMKLERAGALIVSGGPLGSRITQPLLLRADEVIV